MSSHRRRSVFREYLEALLVAALFLGFSNTFVLKTFFIPSGSMESTLLIGDHLIVNRFIFGTTAGGEVPGLPGRSPSRGDVVIFRSVEDPRIDLVKRCVATGGDSVEIVNKQLYVNGERVEESHYVEHRDARLFTRRQRVGAAELRRDNMPRVIVPDGHYFFLGDNRDHSYDSRFWGVVPERYVKGRAFLIYWSNGGETSDGRWPGTMARLTQLVRTAVGFVTNSRWSRTFMLVR
jgi:signal peptidase I